MLHQGSDTHGSFEHVGEVGPYLLERLQSAFSGRPYVSEVRGAGLLAAIEFARPGASASIPP